MGRPASPVSSDVLLLFSRDTAMQPRQRGMGQQSDTGVVCEPSLRGQQGSHRMEAVIRVDLLARDILIGWLVLEKNYLHAE